jgi:hypothetical protein
LRFPRDCANPAHDRLNDGHVGGRLAARDQLLLQFGKGRVFRAASRARFEVCLALGRFLIAEQPFNAGNQIVPAFDAVHGCSF